MNTWAVLATGPSMSQEQADFVYGKCSVVAVSDAYLLAPWADALVSNDSNWWNHHPNARNFAGRKYSAATIGGVERLTTTSEFQGGTNSGLQGMRVARMLGATRILLLGFDMSSSKGAHYFGDHPPNLRNTTLKRFAVHISQFNKWKDGCEVINCTPGSALKKFRFMSLHEALDPKDTRLRSAQTG